MVVDFWKVLCSDTEELEALRIEHLDSIWPDEELPEEFGKAF